MNEPLVSIVTPSYNQGLYLAATIESVLSQTYDKIEYIVIDGLSTDQTSQVLHLYEEKLSKLVCEPDTGQANAINKGFHLASGDIVGWINSDDILYSDTVETVVEIFSSNPDIEVIYGNADYGDSTQNINRTIYGSQFEFVDSFRRLSIPMPQQGCFWRKSVFEKCGYLNEAWHYVLDRDYFIRISDRCNLFYIDRSLGLFRSHGNSKSVADQSKWPDELIRLYLMYFTHPILQHPIHHYKHEVLAAVYLTSASLAIKNRSWLLGLLYVIRSIRAEPLFLIKPFFLSKIFGIFRFGAIKSLAQSICRNS